jgi:hypothetical protein
MLRSMERLPEEKLESLLPALNEIVQYINNILFKIKCEPEDWAINELNLWANIFIRAHTVTDATKINNLQTELLDRGIPEFPVVMAIDNLLKKPSVTPSIADRTAKTERVKLKIVVEPSSIDFGVLKPGEGGVTAVVVKGGQVSVINKSNHFRVMLINRGNDITSLKVELFEGKVGETLNDYLIINTTSGDISVPVKARWSSMKTSEPPLLSWCPKCKQIVGKKSLFYNKYAKQFECFNCKRIFPFNDPKVAASNKE